MLRRVPCLEKLERLTAFRPATPLSKIIDRVSLSLLHPRLVSARSRQFCRGGLDALDSEAALRLHGTGAGLYL